MKANAEVSRAFVKVLFVLVCGYLPFDAKDFQTLFRKILSGNYAIPDNVSDGTLLHPRRRAPFNLILRSHRMYIAHPLHVGWRA